MEFFEIFIFILEKSVGFWKFDVYMGYFGNFFIFSTTVSLRWWRALPPPGMGGGGWVGGLSKG